MGGELPGQLLSPLPHGDLASKPGGPCWGKVQSHPGPGSGGTVCTSVLMSVHEVGWVVALAPACPSH